MTKKKCQNRSKQSSLEFYFVYHEQHQVYVSIASTWVCKIKPNTINGYFVSKNEQKKIELNKNEVS